mgnify:CR=1 FL=1
MPTKNRGAIAVGWHFQDKSVWPLATLCLSPCPASDFDKNQTDFDSKKQELEKQGINDIANFEKLTNTKEAKEKELAIITSIETNLASEILLYLVTYKRYKSTASLNIGTAILAIKMTIAIK